MKSGWREEREEGRNSWLIKLILLPQDAEMLYIYNFNFHFPVLKEELLVK